MKCTMMMAAIVASHALAPTMAQAAAGDLLVAPTRVILNNGGNAELVSEGRTGKVVPAADVESMARALVEMAGQPAGALAMGQAGRAEVERRFSMQAMVAAYQGLYDRLLERSGNPIRTT